MVCRVGTGGSAAAASRCDQWFHAGGTFGPSARCHRHHAARSSVRLTDLGMRLRAANGADAVHWPFVRSNAGRTTVAPIFPAAHARSAPTGLFPTTSDFAADDPDPVTGKIMEPFFRRWAARFVRLRILQQGNLHVYLIYIALTVVLALLWVSLRTGGGPHERVPGAVGNRGRRCERRTGPVCPAHFDGGPVAQPCPRHGRRLGRTGGNRGILDRGRSDRSLALPWSIPGAEFSVGIDGLSAIFLLPVFLISLLGNWFGLGYWTQTEHPRQRPKAAALLRHSDRRHGAAGDCEQQHLVPRSAGRSWRFRPFSWSRPRRTTRTCARRAGSTWWRRTLPRCACSPCSRCCAPRAARSR